MLNIPAPLLIPLWSEGGVFGVYLYISDSNTSPWILSTLMLASYIFVLGICYWWWWSGFTFTPKLLLFEQSVTNIGLVYYSYLGKDLHFWNKYGTESNCLQRVEKGRFVYYNFSIMEKWISVSQRVDKGQYFACKQIFWAICCLKSALSEF